MKLVSYLHHGHEQLALFSGGFLYDTDALHPELPSSMNMFLNYWEDCHPLALTCATAITDGRISTSRGIPADSVDWLAPVPLPGSVRIALAPKNGLPQLRSADHQLVRAPGQVAFMPDHLQDLRPALSVAALVCRPGRNIPAEEADQHIAGMLLMGCFHAPHFQEGETALTLGPCLYTLDEFDALEIPSPLGHVGKNWNVTLRITVNGTSIGTSNLDQIPNSFAELTERASYGRDLFPGDIIAAPITMPMDTRLQTGDVVEFGMEGFEVLTNTIAADEEEFSLLNKVKVH